MLKAEAELRCSSVAQWLVEVAQQHVTLGGSIFRPHRTNPHEWARQQFDEWVDSHDPKTPVLSDEAMSRESIYPDGM